jgi:hypothetical protein
VYVLAVATILVGGVALLNLVLTLGVLRRLREHTSALGEQVAGRPGSDAVLLEAGSVVAASGANLPALPALVTA